VKEPPSTLALIGLRCSGKSRVGRELASLCGARFVDLDEEVLALALERRGGGVPGSRQWREVGQVLSSLGMEAFRELEAEALAATLRELETQAAATGPAASASAPRAVLATGGGVVERPANRKLLRERTRCVWLRVEVPVLQARLGADRTLRPALWGVDPVAELPALSRRRDGLYRETAERVLECGDEHPEALARRILLEGSP
jgi:shikimate kinase